MMSKMKKTTKKTAKKKAAQGLTMSVVKQRKSNGKRSNVFQMGNTAGFKKGVSGNPEGRPSKEDCLTSIMKEKLAEVDPKDANKLTRAELVVVATIELAKKGNAAALKEVWERSDGKVKDKLEVKETSGMSDQAVLLSEVSTLEELKDMQKRIRDHQRRGSG